MIDYAFHLILSDPTDQVLGQELPALIKDGYTSFKIYMTYDDMKLNDREILVVLGVARRERAMTMIHAENADCISWLTEQLEAAGHTEPRYHAASRPSPVGREATHRAATLAEIADSPVLIVHVSGAKAIDRIRAAQARGVVVCDGGELKAEIGRGEFLRCATPEPATLASGAHRASGA